MPVKYKVTEKTEPGVVGGGKRKYYALPVMGEDLILDEMIGRGEKISTVSGGDIHAVLYVLADIAIEGLANGSIVYMGELGNFRISLSSEGKDSPEEVTAAAVKKLSIIYTPGPRLKEMLKNVELHKV